MSNFCLYQTYFVIFRCVSLQVVLLCAQAHVFVIIFHLQRRKFSTFKVYSIYCSTFRFNVFWFLSFQLHVWTQNVRSCRWNAVHLNEVDKRKYGTVRSALMCLFLCFVVTYVSSSVSVTSCFCQNFFVWIFYSSSLSGTKQRFLLVKYL